MTSTLEDYMKNNPPVHPLVAAMLEKAVTEGKHSPAPNIEIAPQDMVDRYAFGVEQVLDLIGHSEALVTDESRLFDFDIDFATLRTLRVESGDPKLEDNALLWQVAKKIQERL